VILREVRHVGVGTVSAFRRGMKTSLAMLLAGLIAAGAWIVLEPGMNGSSKPSPATTSTPAAPHGPAHSP